MAEVGHPEQATQYYTAALDLLLHGDDPNPARPHGPRWTPPIPRIRAARHRMRERLDPSRDENRPDRVEGFLEAARNTRAHRDPVSFSAHGAAGPPPEELIARLSATVEVEGFTGRGTVTHRTLHLSEHRDEWWLPLSALGPYAVLLRVTTAAPRRFRPLRVEPVEPPATDTERAILDTVEEAGYTLVPAAEAAVTVTVPDSTGEPVNRPLYQVLFDTVPGSDGELPWR